MVVHSLTSVTKLVCLFFLFVLVFSCMCFDLSANTFKF